MSMGRKSPNSQVLAIAHMILIIPTLPNPHPVPADNPHLNLNPKPDSTHKAFWSLLQKTQELKIGVSSAAQALSSCGLGSRVWGSRLKGFRAGVV